MDRQEFKDWFEEFRGKKRSGTCSYGVDPNYTPKDLDKWLDEVEQGKDELKSLMGGEQLTFGVETSDDSIRADYYVVAEVLNRITRLMPDYLSKYNLDITYFTVPNATIGGGKVAGTKHIATYAKKIKLSQEKHKELSKILCDLGQIWAKCINKKMLINITVTVDPRAFCLLGRYSIDGGSCFAHGSFNSDKKYSFAAHPNTFVEIFHTKPIDFVPRGTSLEGRALGLYKDNCISLLNKNISSKYLKSIYDIKLGEMLLKSKVNLSIKPATLTKGIHYPYYVGTTLFKQGSEDLLSGKEIQIDTKYSKESHPSSDQYARWD